MTFRIADNFLHHPYTRMAKAFMPNFECVNILKNYLVRNMRYGFDVCVVQSGRKRGNFLNNSLVQQSGADNVLNSECNEQVFGNNCFSLICKMDYIHLRGCLQETTVHQRTSPLVTELTANLLLILTVSQMRSLVEEASVVVQVPLRLETPFHNTPP